MKPSLKLLILIVFQKNKLLYVFSSYVLFFDNNDYIVQKHLASTLLKLKIQIKYPQH